MFFFSQMLTFTKDTKVLFKWRERGAREEGQRKIKDLDSGARLGVKLLSKGH